MIERQFGNWDEAQQDSFVDNDFKTDQFEVILYGSNPCGYFSTNMYKGKINLMDIAIHPEYQCLGIGGAIIEQLKKRSKEEGTPLFIGAFKTNCRAQRFYEKHELKRSGETGTHFLYEWGSKS